jgi:DNA-binding transcriptional regulator YiaG
MNAAEFKAAMKHLKLSLTAAAELLDVDRSAVVRWRKGDRQVPGPAASYLRHLLKKKPRR